MFKLEDMMGMFFWQAKKKKNGGTLWLLHCVQNKIQARCNSLYSGGSSLDIYETQHWSLLHTDTAQLLSVAEVIRDGYRNMPLLKCDYIAYNTLF